MSQTDEHTALPNETEVLGYMDTLSNWGRWGERDTLGTLNLVTPEVRRAAAALVTEGLSISCANEIPTTPQGEDSLGSIQTLQRHMLMMPNEAVDGREVQGFCEHVGFFFHGANMTHLDALSHYSFGGKLYGGETTDAVTPWSGAEIHDVSAAAQGVFTRGVLLDIPAVRGVDWLEPGDGVGPADLDAACARQSVEVGSGDAVLLYTGYRARRAEVGASTMLEGMPGFHASSLPWLHEKGVAVIGSDTGNDVMPSGYAELRVPIHIVGIVAMGLWLLDACNFEALRSACIERSRYEFLFTLAPLMLTGCTGSPVNPVATF